MQTLEELPATGESESPTSLLLNLGLLEKLPVTLASGALLGCSSPGLDMWWLAWFGLIPLIILTLSCKRHFEALLLGFVFGVGYYLVSLRWLLELYSYAAFYVGDWLGLVATAQMWLLESMHEACLYAIFGFFIFALPKRAGFLPHFRRPFYPFLLSIPLIWIFLFWVIAPCEPFLGLPLAQLAYSQASQPHIIQLASFGGAQLVEFLLVVCNCAIASFLIESFPLVHSLPPRTGRLWPKSGAAVDLAAIALILFLTFGWGARVANASQIIPYPSLDGDKNQYAPPVSIAILQGARRSKLLKSETNINEASDPVYLNLANGLGVNLLFLPEAAFKLTGPQSKQAFSNFLALCLKQKQEAVTGVMDTWKGSLVTLVRLLGNKQTETDYYIKSRLIPVIEYIPLGQLGSLIPAGLKQYLPSASGIRFEATAPFLLQSIWGKIGPSLALEVIYPEVAASECARGAALLLNFSDLNTLRSPVLSKQLLAAAILRAVENKKYCVVASNMGTSAVINPCGVITSLSAPGQRGVLIDRIQFLNKPSFFTKMWWLWMPSYRIWWQPNWQGENK